MNGSYTKPWSAPALFTSIYQKKSMLKVQGNYYSRRYIYKACGNKLIKLLKNSKPKYFINKFSKCNNSSQGYWSTINALANKNGKDNNLPTKLTISNTHSTEKITPKALQQLFCKYHRRRAISDSSNFMQLLDISLESNMYNPNPHIFQVHPHKSFKH